MARGSIQRKGKRYYVVIPIGHRRKWFPAGTTKREAEKVLAEKLAELSAGSSVLPPEVRFSFFCEEWLSKYAKVSVKPSTFRRYEGIIRNHFIPRFGDKKLSRITTGMLQGYVAERLSQVSPTTVLQEVVLFKEMFKHAQSWGYIKHNPAQNIQRPRREKKEIDILTPEEIELLLENTHEHYRVAFLIAVMTGLRAGELWGLKWDDIDWYSKQIYVRRTLWNGEFHTPKSRHSIRKVDIPDILVEELRLWELRCPPNKYNLVFPSPKGEPSEHQNVVNRYFKPALKRAGLRVVSFHSLRHTNASMRIRAGQNIKYIQRQLGHASINTTLDIYGHLFEDMDFNRSQARLLDGVLRNSVRNPLEIRKSGEVS